MKISFQWLTFTQFSTGCVTFDSTTREQYNGICIEPGIDGWGDGVGEYWRGEWH